VAGAAAENLRFPLLASPDRGAGGDTQGNIRKGQNAGQSHALETETLAAGEDTRAPAKADYTITLARDATHLLLEAIRAAGPDRVRIREMLHSLSPWKGEGGEVRFDGTGQNTRPVSGMGTVRNGQVIPVASANSPEGLSYCTETAAERRYHYKTP
jgi:ABC-type branched-subunit amino acid transport system substrate-binding protein